MHCRTFIGVVLVAILIAACSPQAAAPGTPTNQGTPAEQPVQQATQAPEQPTEQVEAPTEAPAAAVEEPTAEAEATAALASVVVLPEDLGDYEWKQLASGLSYPLGFADVRDGTDRIFILSQSGLIYIMRDDRVLPEPFLDLSSLVSGPQPGEYSERGLLGVAFHPQYAENGFFYVNYTDNDRHTIISRFQVTGNPDVANIHSETILLVIDQPYKNHNGGAMVFGPDGYLYIGMGDGGSAGDPEGRGQSLDTLLGKILRIDVDSGSLYGIPADNPFVNGGGLPEIWAYGLRNPWRIAFDSLTGDLYVADVGQDQWEEVNFVPAGSPGGINFGWDFREGMHAFEGEPPAGMSLHEPVAEYSHAEGGCSVTGGVVVRDPRLPDLQGVYLYGDYCSGKVWGLWRDVTGAWQSQVMFETGAQISSFGESVDGRVFMSNLAGSVYALQK